MTRTRVPLVILLASFLAASASGQVGCGDCDSSGVGGTILDSLQAAQIAVGIVGVDPTSQCSCDVNDDGQVNVLDSLGLAQAAAGLPVILVCPAPLCGNLPPSVTIVWPQSGTVSGDVEIVLDIADPNSDPLDVRLEWSTGGAFVLATPAPGGALVVNPSAAVPPAAGVTFVWDTAADLLGAAAPEMVALRVTVDDLVGGSAQAQSAITVNNAPRDWALPPAMLVQDALWGSIAFDSSSGETVVFGGFSFGAMGISNLTQIFDGATWSDAMPATSPPARADAAMAFDSVRNEVVLFGGGDSPMGPGAFQDTWVYTRVTGWQAKTPATSPPALADAAMCFDSIRGEIVMFGGRSNPQPVAATWSWDGVTWTERLPVTTPVARSGCRMAFDSRRGVSVLFGGTDGGQFFTDTWEWDGSNWSEVQTMTPPQVALASVVYDEVRGVTVLYAAGDLGAVAGSNTAHFDGVDWAIQAPTTSPNPHFPPLLARDSWRDTVVLVGGFDHTIPAAPLPQIDTWLYR